MAMLPHQLRKAVADAEAHAAAAAGQQANGRGGPTDGDGRQELSAGEADRLRQLQRDRAQLQLRKLQADAGLISKQAAVVAAAGLEWLYDNPKESREAQEVQREAYLLGKPIEAPSFSSQTQSRAEQIASAGVQAPGRGGGAGGAGGGKSGQIRSASLFLAGDSLLRASDDTLRKLREDPLFLIKQAEIAQKRVKESNPLYRQQQEERQRREEEARRRKEAYDEEKRRKKVLKKAEKKARKQARKERRREKKRLKKEDERKRSRERVIVKEEARIKHERETNGKALRIREDAWSSHEGGRGGRWTEEEDWKTGRRRERKDYWREREPRKDGYPRVHRTNGGGKGESPRGARDVTERRRERDFSPAEASPSPVREKRTRRREGSSSSGSDADSSSSSTSSSSPSPDSQRKGKSTGCRHEPGERTEPVPSTGDSRRHEGGEHDWRSSPRVKRERRSSSSPPRTLPRSHTSSKGRPEPYSMGEKRNGSLLRFGSSSAAPGRPQEEAKEGSEGRQQQTEANHLGGAGSKQPRVLGPARPEAAAIQAEAFGVTDDIAPPEAIQEKARLLQEKKEAEQRAAVAARNAAIDQAVREQRERDEKMKAAASRDALEEKLRRMKEEGQRHEEDKARRHELLSVKEKLQEQLEHNWRVKSEGGELMNSIQRQAFLSDGKTVADFLQRRRARRRKDLDDGHDLLASNAEQR